MATGVKFGGEIDQQYFINKISSAKSVSEARKVLQQAMEATYAGTFNVGVSKGDQQAVVNILKAYSKKYNANVDHALNIWDPKNDIKSNNVKSKVSASMNEINKYFSNGYQPNTYDGLKLSASGDKVMMNGKEQNVWNVGTGGKNQVVWEGDGKGGGKYITLAEYKKKYASNTNNETIKDILGLGNYDTSGGSGSGSGGSGTPSSGGGGSYSYTSTAPQANKIDWQNKTIDEMAKIVGMENYKYEDILKLYDNATNAKFNEYDTQLKRAQSENLRTLQGQYDTYLDQLRENRANAISNGMTKGAAVAQQLASMYAAQQTINETQQGLHDTIYDTIQQRGTALEENKLAAQQERRSLEEYLGSLRGTYEANSVNELAARLSADSQIRAAQIGANATTRAAQINASAAGSGNSAANDLTFKYYLAQAGGDYATAVNNYIAQIERDSRTNQLVAQNSKK